MEKRDICLTVRFLFKSMMFLSLNSRAGGWANNEGSDFIRNHLPDTIDFASAHVWVNAWLGNSGSLRLAHNHTIFIKRLSSLNIKL